MKDSRLPGFYRMTVSERIDALERAGWLGPAAVGRLRDRTLTGLESAECMSENVIGVFGLPLAVAPNFTVNGRDRVVPMAVEEPSIVAGVSGAAKLARVGGGFTAELRESLLPGQVLVLPRGDAGASCAAVNAARNELLAAANALQPRLVQRGGGARELRASALELPGGRQAVRVELRVDTCDAMGANVVNTMCEGIAARVGELADGHVLLGILSNLADRSLVRAAVTLPLSALAADRAAAERLREAIVLAWAFADADPHRAATHNKGIMNGVDAVALATGNDWRAIEAGAHAWAARDGRYRSLTRWFATAGGDLAGELVMPLKVGIVGGSLRANPAVGIGLELLDADSAQDLAEVMAAVGLAQNFAALRALVTEGIQKGHLRLHARSVAASVGTPPEDFARVVSGLVESGEVKAWKAEQLLAEPPAGQSPGVATAPGEALGEAAGKVILLGEHAVVYGRHALALPIPAAVTAAVRRTGNEPRLTWSDGTAERRLPPGDAEAGGLRAMLGCIGDNLGLGEERHDVRIESAIPPAAGLGASAAVAVALLRAFSRAERLNLDDEEINRIAFECEKLAHGNPSGIDNRLATGGRPLLYRKGDDPVLEELELAPPPPLVIAASGRRGMTREQVEGVRARREHMPQRYDAVFDQIDAISLAGARALVAGDYDQLGALMNLCQGMLNALGVSTPELEHMVAIARQHGATGAKLTGAGGGGSVVALCPGTLEAVEAAFREAGYRIVRMPGRFRHQR